MLCVYVLNVQYCWIPIVRGINIQGKHLKAEINANNIEEIYMFTKY